MNNAVLISIKPKWCELIASGEKSIEVRKTGPKAERPFKCYIYCTKDGADSATHFYECADGSWWDDGKTYSAFLSGYVIGEFTCDWCEQYIPCRTDFAELSAGSLVEPKELYEYAKGKPLYGWHISDLKIYEEMKPLESLKRWEESGMWAHLLSITRPPQSWFYVEEVTE